MLIKKIIPFLLFLSFLANIVSLYVLDKALFYRSEITALEQRFPNQGIHLTTAVQTADADLHPSGVFLGGGLVRLWYLPPDLPIALSNQSGIEEKISVNYDKLLTFVVPSKVDYLILNGGFCEIHTAVNSGKAVEPVIQRNFQYLKKIVETTKQHHIIPVLTTLTPVRSRFLFPTSGLLEIPSEKKERENASLEQYNELIRTYAADNKIALIDFHDVMKDGSGALKKEFAITDGEHINAKGYRFLNIFLKKELERVGQF